MGLQPQFKENVRDRLEVLITKHRSITNNCDNKD